jgi:Protein of unknown function (DUF4239)
MTRWLLNTFPTWAIAAIVVGALVLITLAGLWGVRRFLPNLRDGDTNEFAGIMAGVIAAVYGVFLAIAIVALYEQMHEAESDVLTEAALLAVIARNSDGLADPGGDGVRGAVRDYRDAVVGPEWESMREGHDNAEAWARLAEIYQALRRHEPRGARESVFYAEAVSAVNSLVEARRARLHEAQATLPGTFMVLLIGGAIITLGFTIVLQVSSRRMHEGMAIALALLLGFSLVVAFVLDHPFSGDVTVSKEPYLGGALKDL